jgi:beta-lactamase superfamily II metal-dependent hydrolase
MKSVHKITIPFLIIILCVLGVTLVAAEGYGVLDSGASGSANVMNASSGIADNVMNTLPSEDESGNVINPSSDNLDNSSLVNSLPSVDKEGMVKNPSSESLGNVMNSLSSEKKAGSKDLKVYYLNTSNGDATLLESSGHFMIINAGDTEDSSAVIDYLNATGITMLDYAIATNLEDSAIGGMKNIMETFPVSIFSSPSNTFSSPTYDKIKTVIEEKEIGFDQATSGSSLPFGDASILFMNTSTSKTNASENAMSILVKTGNVTFLFTGNQNLGTSPATVWAVPYNTGQEALASLSEFTPEALVINPGPSGTDKITLNALKKLNIDPLLTNVDGNIVVSTDGNEYQITTSSGKTFKKPAPVANTTTQASSGKNTTSPDAKTSIGIATNSVI